ncbi:hypothetical protein HNO86_02645 [Pseudomonas sp. C1C7]|uniref:hypothetical protein n=1 Tax=Pseudomonas sp. C1C7 TaxID=2735272 RepID=UPI001586BF5D|nr:hypothetical protein [Pseudomonas sp. C1C7]NUT73936.1 hypothetical protein [Pseudomonas sp. C1C7]
MTKQQFAAVLCRTSVAAKICFPQLALPHAITPVGAAAGCDLLTLFLKGNIKKSQPAAAPAKAKKP